MISLSETIPKALNNINKGTTISKPKILTVIRYTYDLFTTDKSSLIGSKFNILRFNVIAFVLDD